MTIIESEKLSKIHEYNHELMIQKGLDTLGEIDPRWKDMEVLHKDFKDLKIYLLQIGKSEEFLKTLNNPHELHQYYNEMKEQK